MIGKEKMWHCKIFPAMKKNFLSLILSALEGIEFTRNTFELYGADFMITEDFETMLIEVNSSPDLSGSTDITKIICASALEDVIKGLYIKFDYQGHYIIFLLL